MEFLPQTENVRMLQTGSESDGTERGADGGGAKVHYNQALFITSKVRCASSNEP